MKANNSNVNWKIVDNKIVFGEKRKYSILTLWIFSILITFLSLMAIVLAVFRIMLGQQIIAVISLAMGIISLLIGMRFGKIANEARSITLEKMNKEILKKHKEKIAQLKNEASNS